MPTLSDYACQWGGGRVARCGSRATTLIQVDSGRLRLRCDEHVGTQRHATPEEVELYLARRMWMDNENRPR